VTTYNVSASTGLLGAGITQTITNYDAVGNAQNHLGSELTWQGKRLMEVDSAALSTQLSFTYDENGLRQSKVDFNPATQTTVSETSYYYNGSVLIGMEVDRGVLTKRLQFSYDASGNVVSVNYGNVGSNDFAEYYYLRNGQGDIIGLLDSNGNRVVTYTYDTWGRYLSSNGSQSSGVGYYSPFRYRGYVYDVETGWYYLQSRYYDPAIGRFISADALLSTGQGVLGYNMYAYCLNSPVNMEDSGGARPYNVNAKSSDGAGDSGLIAGCSAEDEALLAELSLFEQDLKFEDRFSTIYGDDYIVLAEEVWDTGNTLAVTVTKEYVNVEKIDIALKKFGGLFASFIGGKIFDTGSAFLDFVLGMATDEVIENVFTNLPEGEYVRYSITVIGTFEDRHGKAYYAQTTTYTCGSYSGNDGRMATAGIVVERDSQFLGYYDSFPDLSF
jgi:RHS repeat-associated protein